MNNYAFYLTSNLLLEASQG